MCINLIFIGVLCRFHTFRRGDIFSAPWNHRPNLLLRTLELESSGPQGLKKNPQKGEWFEIPKLVFTKFVGTPWHKVSIAPAKMGCITVGRRFFCLPFGVFRRPIFHGAKLLFSGRGICSLLESGKIFGGPSIRAWRKLVAHGFVKRYEAEPLRRMGPARRWLLLQQVTQLLAKEVWKLFLFGVLTRMSPIFLGGMMNDVLSFGTKRWVLEGDLMVCLFFGGTMKTMRQSGRCLFFFDGTCNFEKLWRNRFANTFLDVTLGWPSVLSKVIDQKPESSVWAPELNSMELGLPSPFLLMHFSDTCTFWENIQNTLLRVFSGTFNH